VTHLDMSNNGLYNLTATELVQVLHAIPDTVTHLNISGNELGKLTATELAEVLRAIPATVTHLDISSNELGNLTATELAEVLRAIPATVTHLNIRSNELGNKKDDEFALLFEALPQTLALIDLQSNGLFTKRNAKSRDALLNSAHHLKPKLYMEVGNNGEANLARVLLPILSLTKQAIIPFDIACLILSYFLHTLAKPNALQERMIESLDKATLETAYRAHGGSWLKARLLFKGTKEQAIEQLRERADKHRQRDWEKATAKASYRTLAHFCL